MSWQSAGAQRWVLWVLEVQTPMEIYTTAGIVDAEPGDLLIPTKDGFRVFMPAQKEGLDGDATQSNCSSPAGDDAFGTRSNDGEHYIATETTR